MLFQICFRPHILDLSVLVPADRNHTGDDCRLTCLIHTRSDFSALLYCRLYDCDINI